MAARKIREIRSGFINEKKKYKKFRFRLRPLDRATRKDGLPSTRRPVGETISPQKLFDIETQEAKRLKPQTTTT